MITQTQIEVLKGKCPECEVGKIRISNEPMDFKKCSFCQGTGQATIEIKKEFKYENECDDGSECNLYCEHNEIQKHKVGDEIHIMYCKECGDIDTSHSAYCVRDGRSIHGMYKLKIISETETHWRVILNG